MTDAVKLFKLLGDETRYRIVCMLYGSDSYAELIAEKLELTPGTVCFHLKKLEAAGIVKCSRRQFYMIYSLNRDIFTAPLESFFNVKEPENDAYRKKVIASFFTGGRLTSIPVQEKKREIVLSEIMKDFTGESYEEREVNGIIMKYYDDFCTLRSWLIADGFMTRDCETYTVVKR